MCTVLLPPGGYPTAVNISYHIYQYVGCYMGRDSSVGIGTGYRLDGRGDRNPVGSKFSAPVQTGPGAYPTSCTMGSGSFPEVKGSGRGGDHPPPSSGEVERTVELCIYSPSGPSWPVLG
jgi:hypothetical protein